MSEWVRAMGIDFGDARIGVAVADEIGLLAHPLETIPGGSLEVAADRIGELVKRRKIEDLIFGLPLHAGGEEGDAVAKVRRFVEVVQGKISSSIRIHEVDERYTTQEAMEKLHEAGRTTRNTRSIIDQAAAVAILQRWLDARTPDLDGEFGELGMEPPA